MVDPFTAYAAYSTARKWVPYAVGVVGGLILAGLLIGVPAYFMVSGAREGRAAAELSRDTYKASAEEQADAVKARERQIDRLNAQTLLILDDWRDTRAAAREVQSAMETLGARYRAIESELTEKSNAEGADPVDLAIDGLRQLCREQQTGNPAGAGGC